MNAYCSFMPPAASRDRHRVEQRSGIGVSGPVEVVRGQLLHQPPMMQNEDPVRDRGHDREVVGHEQQREPLLSAQVAQQRQDLALNRDVQPGERLVAQEQRWLQCQGSGNGHALLLTPRQLEGVGVQQPLRVVAGQASRLERFGAA